MPTADLWRKPHEVHHIFQNLFCQTDKSEVRSMKTGWKFVNTAKMTKPSAGEVAPNQLSNKKNSLSHVISF